jgi:hypothetical protein
VSASFINSEVRDIAKVEDHIRGQYSEPRHIPFLWLSIVALMLGLAPLSIAAIWLLLPYLLWVTFAAFLNLTIVRMNGPFRGSRELA